MDSAEYKTLIKCYHSLVICIQQSPNEIVDHPGASESLTQRDLRNPTHEDDDKARRLLDCVVNQV